MIFGTAVFATSLMCTIAGDINLKVPATVESSLDLKADSVAVDKQLDMTSLIHTKIDTQQHITGMTHTHTSTLIDTHSSTLQVWSTTSILTTVSPGDSRLSEFSLKFLPLLVQKRTCRTVSKQHWSKFNVLTPTSENKTPTATIIYHPPPIRLWGEATAACTHCTVVMLVSFRYFHTASHSLGHFWLGWLVDSRYWYRLVQWYL